MFPIVIVFDRLPPFMSIINPSQCSYLFILNFTSVCYNVYLVLYNHIHANHKHLNHHSQISRFPVNIQVYNTEFKISIS